MSSPADSFFDIWYKITFVVVFIGTLLLTVIAPVDIWPGGILFPKYVEICVSTCYMVDVPINSIWSGLINAGTYIVLASAGFAVVRSIWRKLKK